jgi:serpin B
MRTQKIALFLTAVFLLCMAWTAAAQEIDTLVDDNSAFAFELYHTLAENADGNMLFSPHSISVALAMTYAGARGETETQMADTLHFTLPQDELHPAFGALNAELASRAEANASDEGTPLQLNIANALWGQFDLPFHPEFVQTIEDNYGAALQLVDYMSDPEGARQMINDWVADETEDLITNIVPEGAITIDTRLVLANAIYFNASWLFTFAEGLTQDDEFTLLDGTQVTVPMMAQEESLLYAAGAGYQVVELPYYPGDMAMLIFLPDAGQFEAFEQSLTAELFSETLQALTPADLRLFMPRFEYEFEAGLSDTLANMGMPIAFTDEADFSGMADAELSISDALHKAFISVDEAGTEAAAATVIIVGVTSAQEPQEIIEFRIDRPFIFTIYDRGTGAILFIGRVLNPAAGE